MIIDNLDFIKIKGDKDLDIKLYFLSTCGFCEEVKKYFIEKKYGFSYVYIDYFSTDIISKINKELSKKTNIKNVGLPIIKYKDSYYIDFEIEDLDKIIV